MKPPVILVVRSDDRFSSLLRNGGCEVMNLELVITEPSGDLSELSKRLVKIEDYDGLFFTSPVAAEFFAQQSKVAGNIFGGKVYVLGERAKIVLENEGFDVVFSGHANTADELITSFDEAEFAGKKLLFIRGDKSLRTIPKLLEDKAMVDEIVVYKTREIRPDEGIVRNISERFRRGEIGWMCFFSPSGVESFRKLFASDVTKNVKAAAIGNTTASKAQELRLNVEFISQRATAEDFAAGLIGRIKNNE